jgi:FKBP-type peptidyl-prolyl cis-trans isomerase SlyD
MSQVISFHYTLTGPKGETIDSSESKEPLTFLVGGGQIIPGLEKEILTMKVGDKKKVPVASDEAYGPRMEQLVLDIPKEKLPQGEIKEGMQFQAQGELAGRPLTVVKMTDTHATLDANHPLAGVDLNFDVEITEIREATKEETEHGHAHGPGGHDH